MHNPYTCTPCRIHVAYMYTVEIVRNYFTAQYTLYPEDAA